MESQTEADYYSQPGPDADESNNWEQRFDEEFTGHLDEVKPFIKVELEKAREEGLREAALRATELNPEPIRQEERSRILALIEDVKHPYHKTNDEYCEWNQALEVLKEKILTNEHQ